MPPSLPSRLLEMVVHTPAVFTLVPLTHSSISRNLASSPTISLQLLSLKSEIMTSCMTKTTKHFQNFSDLSLNVFTSHIFVTVDTTTHFPIAELFFFGFHDPCLSFPTTTLDGCFLWVLPLAHFLLYLLSLPISFILMF